MISKKSAGNIVGIGLISAIAASLCCITPVIALLSGVSGMTSAFSWIEPFRPIFIIITIFSLGWVWYQKLRKREVGCHCDNENQSFWKSKLFFGIATLFSILMLSFPYYSFVFYPVDIPVSENYESGKMKQSEFIISGLTCQSCESHVKFEVNKIDGILNTEISYSTGYALVSFDSSLTSLEEIIEMIDKTGYKVESYNLKK